MPSTQNISALSDKWLMITVDLLTNHDGMSLTTTTDTIICCRCLSTCETTIVGESCSRDGCHTVYCTEILLISGDSHKLHSRPTVDRCTRVYFEIEERRHAVSEHATVHARKHPHQRLQTRYHPQRDETIAGPWASNVWNVKSLDR